jgi:hypothetical protein
MYCVQYWRVQKRSVNKLTNDLRKCVNSELHQLIYILKTNFINKAHISVILPNVRCSILRKSFNKDFK